MRSALILAGGRSTRFGTADKALAEVDGTPLLRRVADRVDAVVDEIVVNCRSDQRDRFESVLGGLEYRMAIDPVPDGGPVAGMRAGLRVVRGQAVAVVACDMPHVDPSLFERLFEVRNGGAIPRSDGRLLPLHAVYDARSTRVAAERTLAAGSRRLDDVVARIDPVVVDVSARDGDGNPFVDVDTPADLAAVTSETA